MEASVCSEPTVDARMRIDAPATAAVRRSPAVGAAILAAGLAGILSAHLWSEAWSVEGPSLAFVPFYGWTLLPVAVLAGLACAGMLRWRPALAIGLVVAPAALAGLDSVSSLTGAGAGAYMPALLVGVVLAGWAVDFRLRAWTPPSRVPVAGVAAWLLALAAALLAARAVSIGDVEAAETFAVVSPSKRSRSFSWERSCPR